MDQPIIASPLPSPAVAFIGRKNSGKTTLVEKVIAEMTRRNHRVGSLKHHGHLTFEIDIPGKDSYRHRQAGSRSTAILSSSRFALVRELTAEMTCQEALSLMPGYDLVVVEGFRQAGLPSIELFREANQRDRDAAAAFVEELRLSDEGPNPAHRSPTHPGRPFGLVTDMPLLFDEARRAHLPVFGFEEIDALCDFLQSRFIRQPLTIAIQAGGESRRMGHSKALMPFLGRPLIEHMIDLVYDAGSEIVVTTNESDRLSYLPERYPRLRLEGDLTSERGALPGLLTAIHSAKNDLVGVVACDMIAFSPRILLDEALVMQAEDRAAVIPFSNGFWEPFAGVYRASRCEEQLKIEVEKGAKRIQRFLEKIDCRPFPSEPYHHRGAINPFANINTQEELTQAELLFRFYR